MKRRNEFLRFSKMFSPDDPVDGMSNNEEYSDDASEDEIDDIIDSEKEKVDYKAMFEKQQEQINLLLAEKEERANKKKESKKEKPTYLTVEEANSIWDKKDAQRRINDKLAGYGLTGEKLEKIKNLPIEHQQDLLDILKEKQVLPNTRKLGGGKTTGGKGYVNLNSVDDMLNSIGE